MYWTANNLGFSHRVSIVRANMHNQICYLKFIRWASNSKTGLVISSAIPQQQQKIKTKPCGNIWTHISASCVLLSHLLFPSIKINIKQRIKTVKKFWAGDHWAGNWRRADLEKLRIFRLIDPLKFEWLKFVIEIKFKICASFYSWNLKLFLWGIQ